MVKVTNGVEELLVTSGVAKTLEPLGFYRVGEERSAKAEKDAEEFIQETAVEEAEDLTEKPISEWTKEELQTFAKENDIDITGLKPKEVRERIKDFLG